jgi:hypothetical protein
MISVWVVMCSTCCVSGLRIGGSCCHDPYSADGIDRLDYVGRGALLRDFARMILPFVGFERLTETAGYIRKGSMAWQPLAST